MEVVKYKAYRIVDTTRGEKYKVGDELPIEQYSFDDYSANKKQIEQKLEENRPSDFPQRNKALFVFPESEHDYETIWANAKYNHNEREYFLLELELTGSLYWLNAACYICPFSNQSEYWKEIDEADFSHDMDIEGLFTGTAIIKKIVRKRHCLNGDNIEIE